jgi:hypothetical protein
MLGGWRTLKHKPSKSNPQQASGPSDYLLGERGYTEEQKGQKKELIERINFLKTSDASAIEINSVQQLLRNMRPVKRDPPPIIIKGDSELVGRIIDGLEFDRKYEGFVWSHAKEDNFKIEKNPEILTESIQLFEAVAFAGIKEEARSIYWVRHLHTGRHEQHCVIPRVHLPTGRSFNPCPPGTESDFDAVRDVINLRYDLADPNDLARAKTIKITPNDPNRNIKQAIHAVVEAKVLSGTITNRDRVIDILKASGFKITRANKSGISVIPPGKQKAFKLKSAFYEGDFENSSQFDKRIAAYIADRKSRKEELLNSAEKRLSSVIERRAQFVNKHYGRGEPSSNRTTEEGKQKSSGIEHEFDTGIETTKKNDHSAEWEYQTDEIDDANQSSTICFGERSYKVSGNDELTGANIDVKNGMDKIKKYDLVLATEQLKQHRPNKQRYSKLQQGMQSIIKIIGNKNDGIRTIVIKSAARATRFFGAAIATTQPRLGKLETASKLSRRREGQLARKARPRTGGFRSFIDEITRRLRKIRFKNEQLNTASNRLEQADSNIRSAIFHAENTIRNTHSLITPSGISKLIPTEDEYLKGSEAAQKKLKEHEQMYHTGKLDKEQYVQKIEKSKLVRGDQEMPDIK